MIRIRLRYPSSTTSEYTSCTSHESLRETEASARQVLKIKAYLSESDREPGAVATMKQPEREAVAQQAGQHTPSEVTGGVVLEKMTA